MTGRVIDSHMAKCPRCEGDGWVEAFDDNGFVVGSYNCPACGGSGKQADVPYDAWLAGQGIDPETGES